MPTQAESLYPEGPSSRMGNEGHPADDIPDIDYSEITQTLNKSLPDYGLPRVSADDKGRRVIETEAPDMKGEKDFSKLYDALRGITKAYKMKDGDKVIMHNREGNQFGYSKDSRHDDPGYGHFFPPKGLMY